MKKLVSIFLVCFSLPLAIFAGGAKETTTSEPVEELVSSPAVNMDDSNLEVQKGGTLTISLSASPSKLDPIHYSGTYESQIIGEVCNTIIDYNSTLSAYVPSLVESWTVSEDGTEYVFQIREGVYFQPGTFQDGREMTAEDVAYSLNRSAQYSDSNRLSMLDFAEVTGENEVTCTLKSSNASFLTALTDAGNVVVPKEEVEGWGDDFGNHLVGTGPFSLKSFKLDQETVLVKNPNYFMGEPNIDELVFKVIVDPIQAVNALQTGDLDIATGLTGESVQKVKDNEDLNLLAINGLHVAYIYFNQVNGPTSDIRVRQAIIEAINVDEMTQSIYKYGEASRAYLPLPPGSWGYDSSLESEIPSYNVEHAKQLLAEAGYADGMTLDLYIGNTPARRAMSVLVQAYLAQVGITVNIHAAEWGTFSDIAMSGNADMYGMSWTWYPDPYFFLNKMFSTEEIGGIGNGQSFSDAEVDALLQQALEVSDVEQRAVFYKEALAKIVSHIPGLYYSNEKVVYGVNNKVHDFIQRADGTIRIITPENNVWVSK
jgi:peptide/nickel transport system substrate-binding protein